MMREILRGACLVLLFLSMSSAAIAQDDSDVESGRNFLENSSFEDSNPAALRVWSGKEIRIDDAEAREGEASLLLEMTKDDLAKAPFKAISQVVDAEAMRGKKVRFSAAVKTADRVDGQAMLWMRVDRNDKNGKSRSIAFDNMQDRPITSDSWGRYEIVLKVDEEADKVMAGLIVSGEVKAWLDDTKMEIVVDDVKTTGTNYGAADAAAGPFFSPWMFLALFALGLMLLSQMPNNFLQRFALKFTFAYWVLYCFSDLLVGGLMQIISSLQTILQKIGIDFSSEIPGQVNASFKEDTQNVVGWVAVNVLRIESPVVVPTGSGDTSFDWARLFACFFIALVIAVVWSAIWRRDTDSGKLRDALRTWLRYALAIVLMGYGLAKAGFISTQFAPAGMQFDGLLGRTYGESSPMGLLWTFMGVSPMYTFFAGLMEVVPAVLLIFRRTTTLGAILAMAVMGNVVMLNMCYDVPVKQYSVHLAVMGLLILLPEVPRMMNVFFWNRATEPSQLFDQKFASSGAAKWTHVVLKSILVCLVFAIPIGAHAYKELSHEHEVNEESELLLLNRGFRWVSEFPYNQ